MKITRAVGNARYASELAYGVAATLYLASDEGSFFPISEVAAIYRADEQASGLSFPEYLAGVGFGPKAGERFYRAVDEAYDANEAGGVENTEQTANDAPTGYEATYEYVVGLSDSELADITRAARSVRAARDAARASEDGFTKHTERILWPDAFGPTE